MPTLRHMTVTDIPAGLRLSRQNDWNQLDSDWRRQLDLDPDGCFLADDFGHVVGTVCACMLGNVAWIALVLVDHSHRGRGIGTALMRRALEYVDQRGARSTRLDATPLGQPMYEKLGFYPDFTLQRHAGVLPSASRSGSECELADAASLEEIVTLDQHVSGTDRSSLLRRLFQEQPREMRVVRDAAGLRGIIAARPGAHAWQIGPCLGSPDACTLLLEDAYRRHAGKLVFVDIPQANAASERLALDFGLHVQRPLVRMTRGKKVQEIYTCIWTSFGPEKG